MASNKLSNRQKMINMMYLVLLAILALNVSAEVLDAFVQFRDRLNESATSASQTNLAFIHELKNAIDDEVENENKLTNVGLKDTLTHIQNRSQSIISILNAHVREMESIADFDPQKGEYRKMDELEKNYQYWMGSDEDANERRGNGAAFPLRDSLNAYYQYLSQLYNTQIDSTTQPQIPLQMKDPAGNSDDPGKRWEQYTFEGPVMANLGTLEALKLEVYQEQKKLLDLLRGRIGQQVFAPDKVVAISAPVSQIVPAGLQFQTRLFVGMASTKVQPEFASGSGQIQLQEGGNAALLQIAADGSQIPAGQNEYIQRYTAMVKMPKVDGTFEELPVSGEFVVRKPEVVVSSAVVQNLYRRCGNKIRIDVPALGDLYTPVVSATDGEIRQSERSNKRFLIDPRGRRSVVTVKSRTNGQLIEIDKINYTVISPPKPEIGISVNGRAYSGFTSVPKSSRVSIKLTPDAEFKAALPGDARYGVERIRVLLKNSLQPAHEVKSIPVNGLISENPKLVQLGSSLRQARPGDEAFIVLEGIYRLNYRGEKIPENRISERDRTIKLSLR